MAASPVFYLLVYWFITVCCVISAFFLIKMIKTVLIIERQEKVKFSIILKYYFLMLLIMSILMFIHTTTVLIIWRDDLKLPLEPFFWTGNFDTACMIIISFTTAALTVDKCLVLLLREKYNSYWTIFLFRISIFINTIIAVLNFTMYIIFRRPELPQGCVATGCLVTNYAKLCQLYSRTVGVTISIIAGIIFIVTITWLKKKQPEMKSKIKLIAEAVVLRAVIFGIFCDFVPHISDTLFVSITGDTPFRYIGPFSRVIMAADILLNSIMNWLVFTKMKKNKVVAIQTSNTNGNSLR